MKPRKLTNYWANSLEACAHPRPWWQFQPSVQHRKDLQLKQRKGIV